MRANYLFLSILMVAVSACAIIPNKTHGGYGPILNKMYENEMETFAGSYQSDPSCYCFVFLFTKTPNITLKRYTRNPNFSAKKAKIPLIELRKIITKTKEQVAAHEALLPTRPYYLPSVPHKNIWHISFDIEGNGVFLHTWNIDQAKAVFEKAGINLDPNVQLKRYSWEEL